MFDDMDWDMDAAADQEEDCVGIPEPAEDEHCFGLDPADDVDPAAEYEPREPIARGEAEEDAAVEVQEEPTPVLPVSQNDPPSSLRKPSVDASWPRQTPPNTGRSA